MQRGLTRLQRAEFVDERLGRPEPVYTFKHALIQEVAYQAVPTYMRHQSHRRVAQVLEARYPEICETQPERLAHHTRRPVSSPRPSAIGSGRVNVPSNVLRVSRRSAT